MRFKKLELIGENVVVCRLNNDGDNYTCLSFFKGEMPKIVVHDKDFVENNWSSKITDADLSDWNEMLDKFKATIESLYVTE